MEAFGAKGLNVKREAAWPVGCSTSEVLKVLKPITHPTQQLLSNHPPTHAPKDTLSEQMHV